MAKNPVGGVETAGGLTKREFEVELAAGADIFIDSLRASTSDYETELKTAVANVDKVLAWLGLMPPEIAHWSEKVVSAAASNEIREPTDDIEAMSSEWKASNMHAGQVVHDAAIASFDIEGDEDGDGYADIKFALASGRIITLFAEGSFWTEYEYDVVDESQQALGHAYMTPREAFELESEGAITYKSSETYWSLEFKAYAADS